MGHALDEGIAVLLEGILAVISLIFPVPCVIHFQALGQIVHGNGLRGPVRVFGQKLVDVVALAVELLAGQRGQPLDVVEVVKAIPVLVELKTAGEERLQLIPAFGGQTAQPQGFASFGGVLCQRQNGGLGVAAHRVEVAGADHAGHVSGETALY